VQAAVNELDGLEQAAGGLALPDLAEAAAAQALDQAVSGDRLGVGFSAGPGVTRLSQVNDIGAWHGVGLPRSREMLFSP
jgi:hypothetical protein